MPEVLFTVQLPDGSQRECYSPSTVILSYFKEGDEMPVAEFVQRSRRALTEASERVRARYGFACSSAADQLAQIEHFTRSQPAEGTVRILAI